MRWYEWKKGRLAKGFGNSSRGVQYGDEDGTWRGIGFGYYWLIRRRQG